MQNKEIIVFLCFENPKKRYYENLNEKTIVDNKHFLENNKTVTF